MRPSETAYGPLLLTALLLVGCGGSGSAPAAEATQQEEATSDAAKRPEEMTPAELGEEIGREYVDAIVTVAEQIAPRPEPEVLRPRLEELKEETVARMVELGRLRQDLDAADRATVNGKVRMAINAVPSDAFSAYAEGQRHYMKTDPELAELIASFNVITQYTDFELLKKQEPEEAKRLGIE